MRRRDPQPGRLSASYRRVALLAFAARRFAAGLRPTAGLLASLLDIFGFAALRTFGRLRKAARCAAANAALAQSASSSDSSNRRAGNCQYEFTVTVLVRV